MSTITKSRPSFLSVLKSLFSSKVDIEEIEDIKLPEELDDVLKSLKVKEDAVEKSINVANSSKKGGFGKKINPNTEKAMRAMHEQIKQNSQDDRDIERE